MRIKFFITSVLVFIALFCFPTNSVALGTSYFVARTGCSDVNSGTISFPFCTVGRALTFAQPGDTINLRSGTYPPISVSKSGTSGNYITISAYGNENVIVSGGDNAIGIYGKNYIKLTGLDITGATGSYNAGVMLSGSSNNIVENCKIHHNNGNNTHGVIINNGSDNVIRNNQIYNNFEVGIKIQGTSSRNELSGNIVYGHVGDPPNSDGIAVSGESATYSIIKDNDVYGNADDGIDTWSSHHHTITGNKSHGNGLGGDGNGFKMGGTATGGNNTIIGNIAFNNDRDGFDSNHSGNNKYLNNVAFANRSWGFQDGEGKLAPCTVSTCRTIFINNIGMNNQDGNINASGFTYLSHNNIWFSGSGNPGVAYNGTRYSSLLSFYSASGNRLDNPNGGLVASYSLDPLFTGPGTGNFYLRETSPAIDRGDRSNPGDIPFSGLAPDIGAVEYIQSGGTTRPRLGDINRDGVVDILDYAVLSSNFGSNNAPSDLNSDGIVNILDFTILSNNFGS